MITPGASELIRNATFTLTRAAGAPVISRPVISSDPAGPTRPEPEPIAALRALRQLELSAAGEIRNYARLAREDGRTWAQVGDALGCKPDPELDLWPGEAAFRRVASDLGSGPSFGWRCPACRQTVVDWGPDLAPYDAERGHADGCSRFAADVAAWDAAWNDQDDDRDE